MYFSDVFRIQQGLFMYPEHFYAKEKEILNQTKIVCDCRHKIYTECWCKGCDGTQLTKAKNNCFVYSDFISLWQLKVSHW